MFRPGPSRGLQYAGFWIRLLGFALDAIPVSVVFGLVAGSQGAGLVCNTASGGSCTFNWTGYLLRLGVLGAYFILSWPILGASPAQRLLRIRVVNARNGERIQIGRATLRCIGLVVAALPLGAGLLWAAFDSRKQGWHDRIAGTMVVRPY
jgi:uncharacterized RDD family membrane protein YckC